MLVPLPFSPPITLFLVTMGAFVARAFGRCADAAGAGAQPAAVSVTPSGKQVHRLGSDGNEAHIDRQGSGRAREGRGPWTCR
jgi:hypothetical protein